MARNAHLSHIEPSAEARPGGGPVSKAANSNAAMNGALKGVCIQTAMPSRRLYWFPVCSSSRNAYSDHEPPYSCNQTPLIASPFTVRWGGRFLCQSPKKVKFYDPGDSFAAGWGHLHWRGGQQLDVHFRGMCRIPLALTTPPFPFGANCANWWQQLFLRRKNRCASANNVYEPIS
jgi:hypothetical protein